MILAFAGQKGGAGKTTIAVSVACELMTRGLSILLVDVDPQRSALTWTALAKELGHPVPSSVSMGSDLYKPEKLPQLARKYDHTVIDCPPRHGEIQRAALICADVVVIPCGQSAIDAWALSETTALLHEAKAIKSALCAVILIAKKQPRTALGKDARSVLSESGFDVLTSEVTARIAYQESLAAGKGPTTYAPRDQAAVEIKALVDELLLLAPPNKKKGRRGEPKA